MTLTEFKTLRKGDKVIVRHDDSDKRLKATFLHFAAFGSAIVEYPNGKTEIIFESNFDMLEREK